MSRLQRLIASMQYLMAYESATIEEDIYNQTIELLENENITYRADKLDEDNYIVDIGTYLLN